LCPPGIYYNFEDAAKVLLIGERTAAGATLEEIRAIFDASGFTLLQLSEI
jgi:hypothetical protein